MDPEVVIVGADGTEHVFPAGFDPQKAAAIVRGGAAPQSDSDQALSQATGDTGNYIAQTIRNIPGDALNQVKGIAGLAGSVYGAGRELGNDVVDTLSTVFGGSPSWQSSRPNLDTLKALPGVIVQHYADYLDPGKAALQVREHPVGTALDVYGAVKGGQAVKAGVKNAAAAAPKMSGTGTALLDAAEELPAVGGFVKAGRRFNSSRAAQQAPPEMDPLARMNAILDAVKQEPVPMPTVKPMASHGATPATASTLIDEVMNRQIDWRTTDAVPIDALKNKSILEPGESQVGLAERLAQAMKTAATDPKAAMEAELLSRALRQRMHIRQGAQTRAHK